MHKGKTPVHEYGTYMTIKQVLQFELQPLPPQKMSRSPKPLPQKCGLVRSYSSLSGSSQIKRKSLRWALIQRNRNPYKKGRFEYRVIHRGKTGISKPRREAWHGFFPHGPQKDRMLRPRFWTSSLQSCETICCFSFPPSTPSVGFFVTADLLFSPLLVLNLVREFYLLALNLMFRTLCMYIKIVLESQVKFIQFITSIAHQEIKAEYLKLGLKERT